MAEFKVGDKVRVVSGHGYGLSWVNNTSTVISVGARYVNIQQPGRILLGEFYAKNLVHVAEPVMVPEVGDTVRVTYTRVVQEVHGDYLLATAKDGRTHLAYAYGCPDGAEIEVIEKAKPMYKTGGIYVDAEGCTVFYNAAGAWLHLRADGRTEYYVPTQPLTEVSLST